MGFWVPCIVVSMSYILLTMFLAEVLRKCINGIFGNDQKSLTKSALLEFIAAAEMCGCAFELIIVADNYGVLAYSLFLFFLTVWWSQQWGESSACPYIHFEGFLQGSESLLEVCAKTMAEVVGGLIVFRYVQQLWSLEFAETHIDRPHSAAFDNCIADLQVSIVYGALIEGAATMLCRLTSRLLSEKNPEYASAIDAFVATCLVVAAFDYSGGYYNPVLATALKFGCKGHTPVEHFIVYWLGSSLGAIASIYVYPVIIDKKPHLQLDKKEKEE